MFRPKNRLRFLTAASLFDGHDASINIIRRILQNAGVEVIHLGHNRSVEELSRAAVQEDVHAVAISSYQGGHIEYFKYLVDSLRHKGRQDIKIFGGGGGVIVPSEVSELEKYGVEKIYSPYDGQKIGLEGIIADMMERADHDLCSDIPQNIKALQNGDHVSLARLITAIELEKLDKQFLKRISALAAKQKPVPILGVTGTGGAGKSSVTDELILRFRHCLVEPKIAVIAVDPTRQKTKGALLGDRIRMNAIDISSIFVRSVATREARAEIPSFLPFITDLCKVAKFDIIIIETPGIGQGDSSIVQHVDVSLYVMTPEFGAQSQLEKIDMLDFADFIAINKMDRKGAADALHDVRKQVLRNRKAFDLSAEEMPVFGCMASKFSDAGVTELFKNLFAKLKIEKYLLLESKLKLLNKGYDNRHSSIIPSERIHYLSEIASTIRRYDDAAVFQSQLARERQHLKAAKQMLATVGKKTTDLDGLIEEREMAMDSPSKALLNSWSDIVQDYSRQNMVLKIGKKEIEVSLKHKTLSGSKISRIALPKFQDEGEILMFLLKENLPGRFPFTAGVFHFKNDTEDPLRMFAGEGDAYRTNARFKLLSEGQEAKRLSTAFDSVTLYGFNPSDRPDIYGKIGNSGVSIATLDDMRELYSGFNLCDSGTSVSMTINGPAPAILAMFLNTAIEQRIEEDERKKKRKLTDEELIDLRIWVLQNVRGTVQADILKEDQGQNTCIFSTEFALRLMADIQEYFIKNKIRKFYSISISGYHIAEAGANPITQLAFTLANGFTFVEAYLARGMKIDDIAPNFSFFFSNGMDPEYTVIGRVARRIWAIAVRDKYGGNEHSQKLKYHTQTSGRSLHAQEMTFNDIRTTLQALVAIYDHTNSLHTNAFDEAVTTPTDNSVRRAMAIQMIINKEWGLSKNENPNQGSFVIQELTDLVEEAVLKEFERLSERGGVLGAMETAYQRSKIQEESLHYERLKHSGAYPIVGVNVFQGAANTNEQTPELQRSSTKEKNRQLKRLKHFHRKHIHDSPKMIELLKKSAIEGDNTFEILMDAVKVCSLGQITEAFFEAGGQYRRNM
ncbi:MAG: Fused isobutyryl-CoA mutase [Alphaproteobacteria bacterium MarineAlpha3_Bin5]|nr:MAG: Fused isobutyryl-CoA mutase [Alphaproteobacteria bacterium MarineAlpha3_Bin5]